MGLDPRVKVDWYLEVVSWMNQEVWEGLVCGCEDRMLG